LAAGLAAQARIPKDENKVFLERLYITVEDFSPRHWGPDHFLTIMRALNGNSHLNALDIYIHEDESVPVLQAVAQNFLRHASCSLRTLGLVFTSVREDSDEDGEAEAMPDELWDAFRLNSSLRHVTICPVNRNDLNERDIARLYQLLASPGNTILSFSVRGHLLHTMARLALEEESEMEVEDTSNGAIDQDVRNHQCIIRRFPMRAPQGDDLPEEVVFGLWKMVKVRFPYLYDLGSMSRSLRDANRWELDDPGALERLSEIATWLERNQVGRALLHRSVVGSVPLSLWPTILSKAGNSRSILCGISKQDQRPPLEGLYYMVQKLLLGGPLKNVVGS